MNTVKCPSCGAAANNIQNCDFCGSLFVRSANLGYDSSKIFNSGSINQIFPGLKEALDLNIKDQNEYDCDYFTTEVYTSYESWLNQSVGNWKDLILTVENSDFTNYSTNEKAIGVRGDICILMTKRDENSDNKQGLTPIQFARFTKMEEFKFFEKVDDDSIFYKLDFGIDTKGAAFLVTKILIEVFGFKLTDNLFITNSVDCIVSGSGEDYSRWEQNQSKEFKERSNRIYTSSDQSLSFPENSSEKDSSIVNKPLTEKKSGPCFIATATMGDYDHPTVIELRDFRDNWILKKSWGDSFVKWYYHYGEIAAKKIENNTALRKISYWFIVKPLYVLSKLIDK